MPKEVWKTKTQFSLANMPAFSPPNPHTTLIGAWVAPNPPQLPSSQPKPWPPLGASPICQSAPAQSAHTRIFFLLFETKPHPCILLEPAIYLPLNTRMPIQSNQFQGNSRVSRVAESSRCRLTTRDTYFCKFLPLNPPT